jgi:hypothetical protein
MTPVTGIAGTQVEKKFVCRVCGGTDLEGRLGSLNDGSGFHLLVKTFLSNFRHFRMLT